MSKECLDKTAEQILITTKANYLVEQSKTLQKQFVFSYTISIQNNSDSAVQLLDRHWHIVDDADRVQEVQGVGVVGKQPIIEPKETFQYTSGAVLESQAGTMSGSYRFKHSELGEFRKDVPAFPLVAPKALH